VLPIQALSVPKVCSTVPSNDHGFGRRSEPCLHFIQHAFMLPALDVFNLSRVLGNQVWHLGLEVAAQAGGQVAIFVEAVPPVRSHRALVRFRPGHV